jgi:hypothetical protein
MFLYKTQIMKTAILIEKNGNIKSISLKSFSKEDLCKKAGFKSMNGFDCYHSWKIDEHTIIQLYGKQTGRVNQENKYEFPPPIDNILFFGACILCRKNELDEIINLTSKEWDQYYKTLYGGFEDIQEEEELSNEEEEFDKTKLTTTGYIKDDFVVEDDEEEFENDIKKPTKSIKKIAPKLIVTDELYLDCTSELSEEEYI